jgi:eukaryotic-like serine/threonine-protein kinase
VIASSALASIAVGEVLAGKYRVDRVLGEGGMGVVVAATHLELDERVALKFMRPELSTNAEAAERFLREARAAVKLKSEHVARIHDVGKLENGAPFIVMEYLEGMDLGAIVEARGPLPLVEACDYVLQACDAVGEAHTLGIVHRDLKPANLFITRRGDGTSLVKVLDFGISKTNALQQKAESITSTKALMGSPHYMAPEQISSTRTVDGKADVWSLGIILYQLTTGTVPFGGESLGEVMAHILQDELPDPRLHRHDLPEEFVAIVRDCLQKDRSRRCKSVAGLARGLAMFAQPHNRMLAERLTVVMQSTPPPAHIYPSSGALPAPRGSSPSFNTPFQGPPTGSHSVNERSGYESGTFSAQATNASAGGHRKLPWIAAGVCVVLLVSGIALIGRARSAASATHPPPSATTVAAPSASSAPPPIASVELDTPDTPPAPPPTTQPSGAPSQVSARPTMRPGRPTTTKPTHSGANTAAPKSLLDDRN